ncbi:hypothetical protein M6D81_18150 [Paenibacillus sp. J5C_2022]|uniref:hypothetical protein n=1 Tax=Paenibacillus sp. J5C2022 TaxID=2977129 RepID=UPI0021D1665C|nr:hypothetical protein [Paenibacillus sp. J5C2022]MCU6710618.1 hypothetical protein [Paenibacillus sp. J5C2022]
MVQGWVTTLVLAFGIAVAIIGVVAYLRLFRKEKASAHTSTEPLSSAPASEAAASKDSGMDDISCDDNRRD